MVWPESGFWGVICEERQMDIGCAAQQSVGCICWWSVWVTGRRGHGPKMFWVLEGLGKQAKATTACHMRHYEVSREESEKGEWLGHVGGSWKDTERTWRSSVIRGNLMQCLEQGGDRCGRTEETLGWRVSRSWNPSGLLGEEWKLRTWVSCCTQWTAMEHLGLWEWWERTLFRGYSHTQKPFSFPWQLLCTLCTWQLLHLPYYIQKCYKLIQEGQPSQKGWVDPDSLSLQETLKTKIRI